MKVKLLKKFLVSLSSYVAAKKSSKKASFPIAFILIGIVAALVAGFVAVFCFCKDKLPCFGGADSVDKSVDDIQEAKTYDCPKLTPQSGWP